MACLIDKFVTIRKHASNFPSRSNRSGPVQELDAGSGGGSSSNHNGGKKASPYALTCAEFCSRSGQGTVAAGDALGRVHVWKLNSELTSTAGNAAETKMMEAFLKAEVEE